MILFRAARVAVAMLFVATATCAQAVQPNGGSLPARARVLLVGNSLTAGNRLTDMVRALASTPPLAWEIGSVTIGGASLADHLAEGTASRRLRDERWDAVVLQQGPSTLPDSRAQLRAGAAAFRPLIASAGGRGALYMVWPDSTWSAPRFAADFDRIRDGYALAARDIDGWFLPAGEAWRRVLAAHPEVALYGPDQFHPTAEGTYLAAVTIVAALSGRDPAEFPATLRQGGVVLVAVAPARADLLRQAARAAIEEFRTWSPPDVP